MPSVLAVLVAALEVLGGLAIAIGFHARIAALALAVFTLLATVLFHNYWAMPAGQQMMQQVIFMKNIAVTGGLLMLAIAGPGAWSVDRR